MATYVYEIINPKTNRKIRVGGSVYKSLIKSGDLQARPIIVIDGKAALNADTFHIEQTGTPTPVPPTKKKAIKKPAKKPVKAKRAEYSDDEEAPKQPKKPTKLAKSTNQAKKQVKVEKESEYFEDSSDTKDSDSDSSSSSSN
jgi:glucan-binding YG repeat protein